MSKEYGGYFGLELEEKEEYYKTNGDSIVLKFNCARNAIAAVALSQTINRIFVPYYNCEYLYDTLNKYTIPLVPYYLDDNIEPILNGFGSGDWLLYVNYFGRNSIEKSQAVVEQYHNVIFDNTQAFFARPILGSNCFNVYSCRKFVGVTDGAYLVFGSKQIFNCSYPHDISWDRSSFLLKSVELGTNAAYADNLRSNEPLGDEIRTMSVLTERLLKTFDYEKIRKIRTENLKNLHDKLKDINQLSVDLVGDGWMVYPFLVELPRMREVLIENKIYVPQWWKYLIERLPASSVESKLSQWLLPLPIDQRYDTSDMYAIANIVMKTYYSCLKED